MKNGYKLLWTDHALGELSRTYNYPRANFSERELKALSKDLDRVLNLIQQNPTLFPISAFKGVRRVVLKKFNTLYYQFTDETIEVLSFYSNRQTPIEKKA